MTPWWCCLGQFVVVNLQVSVCCCLPAGFQFVVVYLQAFRVQVRLVFVCWFVSSVAVFDHWVQQIFEHLVSLLVSGDTAHRHDERVTCGDTKWSIISFLTGGHFGWSSFKWLVLFWRDQHKKCVLYIFIFLFILHFVILFFVVSIWWFGVVWECLHKCCWMS